MQPQPPQPEFQHEFQPEFQRVLQPEFQPEFQRRVLLACDRLRAKILGDALLSLRMMSIGCS